MESHNASLQEQAATLQKEKEELEKQLAHVQQGKERVIILSMTFLFRKTSNTTKASTSRKRS